ncbi:protein YgfX [Cellvibrio zantedeschiae]|uniref:protein YgfX n=1 Tax=Cellvibrio zantedeschiae TaxID=1237077 RepID=UPI0016773690|nr:protein YgfX [Cellvibrio zantedeschiae]
MSEIIPASSPNSAADSHLATSSTTTAGVDLAPIVIVPSIILWRLELAVYSSILCAAAIALFPFFLTAFYWPLLWLMFLILVAFVLRQRWRAKNSLPISLEVQKNVWRLKSSAGESIFEPFGEILLWSGVIILPLRETISGRIHRIVILQDSVKPDDWRCLRVWLRTGFKYR